MDDPSPMPAVELTRALRRREVSSRELLELFLRRIEADHGVASTPSSRSTSSLPPLRPRPWMRPLARGEQIGPLCWLPMTVKDTIETAGLRTTAGAPELAGHVPTRDADAVSRLREGSSALTSSCTSAISATAG